MRLPTGLALLVLATGLSAARPALADDSAAAQALFNDGKRLMTAGKYAEACPKFEESERVAPAMGTKFHLAECYEHPGRIASAWADFLSVAAAAKNAGQGQREKAARDRAAAIEPKLSRLTIGVPAPSRVAGLAVKRDDIELGQAQWGEAMPVDPGEHLVSATAPGKRPWKAIVEIDGIAGAAKVIVPPLDDEPAPPPAPVAAAPVPSTAPPASVQQPVRTVSSGTSPTAGWVLVGVGAASLIGGGIAWALRSSEVSKLQSECGADGQSCPSGAAGDISSGQTDDALGIGLFAAGGACVAAGVVWLVVAAKSHGESRATATSVVPLVAPGTGGMALRGTF
jgi:hypothetical protein